MRESANTEQNNDEYIKFVSQNTSTMTRLLGIYNVPNRRITFGLCYQARKLILISCVSRHINHMGQNDRGFVFKVAESLIRIIDRDNAVRDYAK